MAAIDGDDGAFSTLTTGGIADARAQDNHLTRKGVENGTSGTAMTDVDSDGSAEMDMSSDGSSTPPPTTAKQPSATANGKRKLSDTVIGNGSAPIDAPKRPKLATQPIVLPSPVDEGIPYLQGLSPECWQEVFTYLPPAMFARGLRVNKMLNAYLCHLEASPKLSKKADPRAVRMRASDSLWGEARKAYFPQLPKPLKMCSERVMIKKLGGRYCELCDKSPSAPAPVPVTQYATGPGNTGVRTVFAFGMRLCGPCLGTKTAKDVQLLQSKYNSLMAGLPFAFLTPEFHLITNTIRKQHSIPGNLRAGKIFFQRDVEALYSEYEEAQSLGAGAAEEWQKGLRGLGDALMADCSRWEKWEATLPLGADLGSVIREYDPTPSLQAPVVPGRSASSNGMQPDQVIGKSHRAIATYLYWRNNENVVRMTQHLINNCSFKAADAIALAFRYYGEKTFSDWQDSLDASHIPQDTAPFYPGLPAAWSSQVYPPQALQRQARSTEEAHFARQARRADLQQRCLQLEPPIMPEVLEQMEAFQNAMQIVQPVNEAQWEMLKPRLEAQREAAELAEHQRAMRSAAIAASRAPNDQLRISRPAREEYGAKYEQSQDILRKKLCEYADDIINGQWGMGRSLNKEVCPIFAVDVLQHVQQKYDLDYEALKARGERPFRHPKAKAHEPDPFLSLENMKHVHDKKVRPLTEQYSYELFVCAGCQPMNSSAPPGKWYALESLIQHYGAKHAEGDFSRDNIVVHWQTAAWPDEPPFDPEPGRFLKAGRPPPDQRGNARLRNGQPQSGRRYGSGAGAPPGAGLMLSESSFFRNESPANGSNIVASLEVPSRTTTGRPGQAGDDSEDDATRAAQEETVANEARRTWDVLDGIQGLPEPIRVQTAMHHAAKKFHATFRMSLPFSTFTDASVASDSMKPVRLAQGLVCQSCLDTDVDRRDEPYYSRIRDAKLHSFERLCVHFDIIHVKQANGDLLRRDWVTRLIEQPDDSQVHELINAKGMNDEKIGLIAEAYPSVFPYPLPSLAELISIARAQSGGSALADRLLKRLNKPKEQQKGRKKGGKDSGKEKRRDKRDGSESLPSAAEDEYDPRRPVLAKKEQDFDPSKFDTDLSKPAPAAAPKDPNALPFALDENTMKALKDLLGPSTQPPAPPAQWTGIKQEQTDMKPLSHALPLQQRPQLQAQPSAVPPTNGTSGGAPPAQVLDISAILRSLEGGQSQTPGQASVSAAPAPLPAREVSSVHQYHDRYEAPVSRAQEYDSRDYHQAQTAPLNGHARDSPGASAYDQRRPTSRYEPRHSSQYQPAYPAAGGYQPQTQAQPAHGTYTGYDQQQPRHEHQRHYAPSDPPYHQTPAPQQYGQDISAALARNAHAYDQNSAAQSYPGSVSAYREASTAYSQHPQYAAPVPQSYRPASPTFQQPPQPQYASSYPPGPPSQYAPPREYAPPPQYYDEYGRPVQMVRYEEPPRQHYEQKPPVGYESHFYQR